MPEPKPLRIEELKPAMNITLVQDGASLKLLREWCTDLRKRQVRMCGTDTETNITPDFWDRRVRTIQMGDKDAQFVIDLLAFAGSEDALVKTQGHYGANSSRVYDEIFEILDPIICGNEVLKVGQNLSFEYEVFNWNFGRRIWHLYSTDLVERVIQAGYISLKNYPAFSMAGIMQRYFNILVDKSEQGNFDLKSHLTQKQIEYAALDTRLPLSMRTAQMIILTRDQLLTTAQIENDALGAYTDMHLTGQNMDDERWMRRIEAVKQRRIDELNTLDATLIPIVGRKDQAIDQNELDRLESLWRNDFETASPQELAKATKLREEKDKAKKNIIREELAALKKERAAQKQEARKVYQEASKKRTAIQKVIEKSEGMALLNYNSPEKLLDALHQIKGLKNLSSTSDDDLLKYNDMPFIQTLRSFKKGKKDTGTYGIQWTQRWVTHPCKEEGWRHPGDGRLHCVYNQLEAETGRTSSSKPNGQNLPHEDDVRACFICDPPDENVRISCCCDADTVPVTQDVVRVNSYVCSKCNHACETKAEEYCIVTCDMSGAELRIIAELANAKSWILAFSKEQDVHSVSTEILYPEKWPSLTVKSRAKEKWTLEDSNKKTGEKVPLFDAEGKPIIDKKTGLQKVVPPCAYYAVLPNGEFAKHKCECPEHKTLRDETKATNFLLCYGGGPDALADELGCSVDRAREIMENHRRAFPDIWDYLEKSGELAKAYKESRDQFGRRRGFPDPTLEQGAEYYKEYNEERLEYPEEIQLKNLLEFEAANGRKPRKDESWPLLHREPTMKEAQKGVYAIHNSIGRKGKNHRIQGTNASIIKRAMGCGFDKDGKPYLWHTLGKYKAKLLNMIHDELVIQCPKRYGTLVLDLIGDAFRRAAAEVMHKVVMEFEGNISNRWQK